MASELKKNKSSFTTFLIVGPLIVLPFIIFSGGNKVFWNEEVTAIMYQIKRKPEIIALYRHKKELRFYEPNRRGYYVVNYGAYELLEDNNEDYQVITNLNVGDSLTLFVPETMQNTERIRIVGLKFKNIMAFTPAAVSKYEKRDLYGRTLGFLMIVIVGLILKLISFIKAKRKAIR